MHDLYQNDERALPGNYKTGYIVFFSPLPNVMSLTTAQFSFSSLSFSFSLVLQEVDAAIQWILVGLIRQY
jgi:hypothetical protein